VGGERHLELPLNGSGDAALGDPLGGGQHGEQLQVGDAEGKVRVRRLSRVSRVSMVSRLTKLSSRVRGLSSGVSRLKGQ
jgi:hypothetical protein